MRELDEGVRVRGEKLNEAPMPTEDASEPCLVDGRECNEERAEAGRPKTNALKVARLKDAVAMAPQKAPSPNAAERRPNARASTWSVSETSSGTSVLKLNPTSPTHVITTRTTRT